MSNDGDRQAQVRLLTGTTLDYNGDFMALFDQAGIQPGSFSGRMLAYINFNLGTAYTEVNGALNAWAASQGFPSWNECNLSGGASSAQIQLSNSSFLAGSAQGTAIGTLSVTGGTGTWAFTLTDNASNKAQVAGTNGVNLQAGSASASVSSFNITVSATNGTKTITRVFLITATSAVVYVPTFELLGF